MSNLNKKIDNHCQTNLSTDEIRRQLLSQLEGVLRHLLPKGKRQHHHYHVGNIHGDSGDSLKVELQGSKAGFWHDFASGEGGDIFDLWASVRGFNTRNDFPGLIEEIKNWLGIYVLTPIQTITETSANHGLDTPAGKWEYTDNAGKVIASMQRYNIKDGGKKFIPWDAIFKRYKLPSPRPLYNQVGMVSSQRIILVEGEKCAQGLIDQGICATTAMGGANASIDKTDWSPLKGKDVIIWPDNDEVGKSYAQKAGTKLLEIGVSSLKIIEIPADKPAKWDVADAIAEKIDANMFINCANFINVAVDNQQIERIYDRDLVGIPPKREWIIPDWLPKGCVTAIYGDGGVGKSLLAQQLMTAVATGKPWLGYENDPIKVYGLLCEDDREEIHRRQNSINQQLGVTEGDFGNMLYVSRVGKDNLLMIFDKEERGKVTTFFNQLLKDIKEFQPQLVVLDTLADLFGGNENIRIQVRQFVQNCCGEIARSVNAAVLLCAHPSDSGIQRKTGTGGSTAWSNTVRSRWYLEKPEEEGVSPDIRILSQKKSNYSSTTGKMTLQWKDGIFVRTDDYVPLTAGEKHSSKCDNARDRKSNEILNLILDEATYEGRAYTMSQFAEAFEGARTKYDLGSKRSIQNRLDILATKGFIKFFQNGEDYGLPKLPRSKFGYMCIRNMSLKVKEKSEVFIQPTHFKCRNSGNLKEEKNPKIWAYSEEI